MIRLHGLDQQSYLYIDTLQQIYIYVARPFFPSQHTPGPIIIILPSFSDRSYTFRSDCIPPSRQGIVYKVLFNPFHPVVV